MILAASSAAMIVLVFLALGLARAADVADRQAGRKRTFPDER